METNDTKDQKPALTRADIETILQIERERAALMHRLKEAVLGKDTSATLALAREVVGLEPIENRWQRIEYQRLVKQRGTIHERRIVDAINVLLEVVRTAGRPTQGTSSLDTPEGLLCDLMARCKAAAIGLEAELDDLAKD